MSMNISSSSFKTHLVPSFKAHSYTDSFSNGLARAYDWTQRAESGSKNSKKVGFYEGDDYNTHTVSDKDLEQAIEKKQPNLVILQRLNVTV